MRSKASWVPEGEAQKVGGSFDSCVDLWVGRGRDRGEEDLQDTHVPQYEVHIVDKRLNHNEVLVLRSPQKSLSV